MKMTSSLLLALFLLVNGVLGFQTSSRCSLFENAFHQPRFSATSTTLPKYAAIDLGSNPRSSIRTPELIQRYSSETSFGFADVVLSKAGTVREAVEQLSERYPWLISVGAQISKTSTTVSNVLVKSWWHLPMLLALVPLYTVVFHGTYASMPHWWQVVNMEYIRKSQSAAIVIGGFLLSNIAYFVSGSYLVNRFPFKPAKKGLLPIQPTRFTMLGIWILLAGAVSTIFHSVQALGSYAIAESLCYVDHGVAISASFYYFKTCGLPSRKVFAIGIAGLAALVLTYPSYALLHSAWHFLSAAAATKWAVEGYDRLK